MGIKKEALKVAEDLVQNETVINKAVEMVDLLFPYMSAKREAVNLYMDEIKNSDLPLETKTFLILNIKKHFKHLKNQKNIAEIAYNNAKQETDFSEKSGVNEEWFDRFMDSAKFVSSDDMQLIWGKILANEFETPGSTPPNMIRILSETTSELASAFTLLCGMNIGVFILNNEDDIIEEKQLIIVPFKYNNDEFCKLNINLSVLNELETLGVIKLNFLTGYVSGGYAGKKIMISIGDELFDLENCEVDEIPIGNVMLTSAGVSLKKITETINVDEYYEIVKTYLKKKGMELKLRS